MSEALYVIRRTTLEDIANAVRTVKKITGYIPVNELAKALRGEPITTTAELATAEAYAIEKQTLVDIADAVRSLDGTTDGIVVKNLAARILSCNPNPKLSTPVIRLVTEDDVDDDDDDDEYSTSAILGEAILGYAILGDDGDSEFPQLATPIIELVVEGESLLEKLDTPVIELVIEGEEPDTPPVEPDVPDEPDEPTIPKLATPEITLIYVPEEPDVPDEPDEPDVPEEVEVRYHKKHTMTANSDTMDVRIEYIRFNAGQQTVETYHINDIPIRGTFVFDNFCDIAYNADGTNTLWFYAGVKVEPNTAYTGYRVAVDENYTIGSAFSIKVWVSGISNAALQLTTPVIYLEEADEEPPEVATVTYTIDGDIAGYGDVVPSDTHKCSALIDIEALANGPDGWCVALHMMNAANSTVCFYDSEGNGIVYYPYEDAGGRLTAQYIKSLAAGDTRITQVRFCTYYSLNGEGEDVIYVKASYLPDISKLTTPIIHLEDVIEDISGGSNDSGNDSGYTPTTPGGDVTEDQM